MKIHRLLVLLLICYNTLPINGQVPYSNQNAERNRSPKQPGEPEAISSTTVGNAWFPLGVGSVGRAFAVWNGNIIVGGSFTQPFPRLALLNQSTNTWVSLGLTESSTVNALAVVGDNLFVGGAAIQASGFSANGIARYNLQTGTWHSVGNVTGGSVLTMTVRDSLLYVGGFFTSINSISFTNGIAVWNLNTQTWSALGLGVSSAVNAIACLGSDVYVGGNFPTAGGQLAIRIARWNSQAQTWGPLGSGIGTLQTTTNTVKSLVFIDSVLYIGGEFQMAGAVNATNIARWDTRTNTYSLISDGSGKAIGLNGSVESMFAMNNQLFVAGAFTGFDVPAPPPGPQPKTVFIPSSEPSTAFSQIGREEFANTPAVNRLVRFNPTANTWVPFITGANNTVSSIFSTGGRLYALGNFTTINNIAAQYSAVLDSLRSPSVTLDPISNVTNTSITLVGKINPNANSIVTSEFQIATDSLFTTNLQTVSTSPNSASLGIGTNPVTVSATVQIQPRIKYYYRLRASNVNGLSTTGFALFENILKPIPTNGLQLWLRADSLVTVASGVVSMWGDLSGNNRNAVSLGAARPSLLGSSTAFNNRPVIDFGNSGLRNLGFPRLTNVRTVYVVARTSASSTFQFLVGDSSTFQFHPTATNLIDIVNAATNVRNGTILINGNQNSATNVVRPSQTAAIGIQTAGDAIASTLGNDRNLQDGRGWRGEIAEVLIYNRNLNSEERVILDGYLADRYQIGVNVVSNPTLPANTFGVFLLGNTGALLRITNPTPVATTVNSSVAFGNPGINGSLPTGISTLANQLWRINFSGAIPTYSLQLNLKNFGGIQNFNSLKVLRRANDTAPWENLETFNGVTLTYSEPFIIANGLQTSGQFAIGSSAENPLSIEEESRRTAVAKEFALSQNYPNPFNPSTAIRFQVPQSGMVQLEVFDLLGRKVATLVNARQESGSYEVNFNASQLSSGVYFYRLQAGSFTKTMKMTLVK